MQWIGNSISDLIRKIFESQVLPHTAGSECLYGRLHSHSQCLGLETIFTMNGVKVASILSLYERISKVKPLFYEGVNNAYNQYNSYLRKC